MARALEEAVRAEAPFDFEARLRMPNGAIKHIRCIAKPARDGRAELILEVHSAP